MKKWKTILALCFCIIGLFVLAILLQSCAKKPIQIMTEEDVVTIKDNGILMRYRHRDVPFKPYVQELFSPSGINILRDAPSDHLHHHALMYAVAVDGVNFWEEQNAPGRQMHVNSINTSISYRGDISFGKITGQLDWVNPNNDELLLKELRTIRICKPNKHKATILCWQSSLSVPSGKESMTLSGSHYFGLGMRFVKSMDTGGEFLNSEDKDGEVVRGDEKLVRANWCAYTAKANGKTVTVAMFGDPDNLRHPTYWFTMTKPFAYLSATLNLHRETLEIPSDRPLMLHYAVVVWDNRASKEQIQKAYDWWAKSN